MDIFKAFAPILTATNEGLGADPVAPKALYCHGCGKEIDREDQDLTPHWDCYDERVCSVQCRKDVWEDAKSSVFFGETDGVFR